jgi:hypothetical protein
MTTETHHQRAAVDWYRDEAAKLNTVAEVHSVMRTICRDLSSGRYDPAENHPYLAEKLMALIDRTQELLRERKYVVARKVVN